MRFPNKTLFSLADKFHPSFHITIRIPVFLSASSCGPWKTLGELLAFKFEAASQTVGFGWIWSDSVGFGRIRSDLVEFGRIRSDLVEFGRIWSDSFVVAHGRGPNMVLAFKYGYYLGKGIREFMVLEKVGARRLKPVEIKSRFWEWL